MDSGADVSDYVVTVGGRRWPVVELSATSFKSSVSAAEHIMYRDSMTSGENITANVTVSELL